MLLLYTWCRRELFVAFRRCGDVRWSWECGRKDKLNDKLPFERYDSKKYCGRCYKHGHYQECQQQPNKQIHSSGVSNLDGTIVNFLSFFLSDKQIIEFPWSESTARLAAVHQGPHGVRKLGYSHDTGAFSANRPTRTSMNSSSSPSFTDTKSFASCSQWSCSINMGLSTSSQVFMSAISFLFAGLIAIVALYLVTRSSPTCSVDALKTRQLCDRNHVTDHNLGVLVILAWAVYSGFGISPRQQGLQDIKFVSFASTASSSRSKTCRSSPTSSSRWTRRNLLLRNLKLFYYGEVLTTGDKAANLPIPRGYWLVERFQRVYPYSKGKLTILHRTFAQLRSSWYTITTDLISA